MPSSRTPEGDAANFRLCGYSGLIEFSVYPKTDATCPDCGCLLIPADNKLAFDHQIFGHQSFVAETDVGYNYDIFDHVAWMATILVTTSIVFVNDGSLQTSLLWLMFLSLVGWGIVPPVDRALSAGFHEDRHFWMGVACGWGINAGGLMLGPIFGVLWTWIYDWQMSSFVYGLIGRVLGPLAAAQELVVIGCASAICRIWLGRWL